MQFSNQVVYAKENSIQKCIPWGQHLTNYINWKNLQNVCWCRFLLMKVLAAMYSLSKKKQKMCSLKKCVPKFQNFQAFVLLNILQKQWLISLYFQKFKTMVWKPEQTDISSPIPGKKEYWKLKIKSIE